VFKSECIAVQLCVVHEYFRNIFMEVLLRLACTRYELVTEKGMHLNLCFSG